MLIILADRPSPSHLPLHDKILPSSPIFKNKRHVSRHFYDLTLRHGIEARHMFVFLYARILHLQICCCNRVCVHMHARYQSGYQEGLELPEKFRQTYYKFQIVRLPKISLGPGLLHGKQSYSRETILDPHTTNLETESTLLMFF